MACSCVDHSDVDPDGVSLFPFIDTSKVYALNAANASEAPKLCRPVCTRASKAMVRRRLSHRLRLGRTPCARLWFQEEWRGVVGEGWTCARACVYACVCANFPRTPVSRVRCLPRSDAEQGLRSSVDDPELIVHIPCVVCAPVLAHSILKRPRCGH
jgi:hypothetical protein